MWAVRGWESSSATACSRGGLKSMGDAMEELDGDECSFDLAQTARDEVEMAANADGL